LVLSLHQHLGFFFNFSNKPIPNFLAFFSLEQKGVDAEIPGIWPSLCFSRLSQTRDGSETRTIHIAWNEIPFPSPALA